MVSKRLFSFALVLTFYVEVFLPSIYANEFSLLEKALSVLDRFNFQSDLPSLPQDPCPSIEEDWSIRYPNGEEDDFPLPIRFRHVDIPGRSFPCKEEFLTIRNDEGVPINFTQPLNYSRNPTCKPIQCPSHPSIEIDIMTTGKNGIPLDDHILRKAAHYLAKNQHYSSGKPEVTSIQSLEQKFLKELKSNPRVPILQFLNPAIKELVSKGFPPDGSLLFGGRNCFSASNILNLPQLNHYPTIASSKAMVNGNPLWPEITYSEDITSVAYKRSPENTRPEFGSVLSNPSHSSAYLLRGFCVEKKRR